MTVPFRLQSLFQVLQIAFGRLESLFRLRQSEFNLAPSLGHVGNLILAKVDLLESFLL